MDKKDIPLLIGTLYQSSFNPRGKLLWKEKFAAVLATILNII